jgi:hypothetical protein
MWKRRHKTLELRMAPRYGLGCGGSGRKAGLGVRKMNWTAARTRKRVKEQLVTSSQQMRETSTCKQGALHVVDGRELGVEQEVDIADQVLQRGVAFAVESGLVALDAFSARCRTERRLGMLMVHFPV